MYLSLYLKQHRSEYYDLLQRVRLHGHWEAWIEFLLHGISETAEQAARTAAEALALFRGHRQVIQQLGTMVANTLRLHEHFQARPVSTIAKAAEAFGLSRPTVGAAVARLVERGIVAEMTKRRRDRVFAYGRCLDLLSAGTELPFR